MVMIMSAENPLTLTIRYVELKKRFEVQTQFSFIAYRKILELVREKCRFGDHGTLTMSKDPE